jgi:hypothetical protein
MPTASRRWICSSSQQSRFVCAMAYIASEHRKDRKPAHGSLWLGTSSPLSDPRSGWGLWRGLHPTTSINGHSRRPTSPRSPWQNGFAERLIGSIRRECLDHVVVFGERHLRHVLLSWMNYYNETRTHLSSAKDAPLSRTVEGAERILCRPVLGGLHHQYGRIDLRQAQLTNTPSEPTCAKYYRAISIT